MLQASSRAAAGLLVNRTSARVAAVVAACCAAAFALGSALRGRGEGARCGAGFTADGALCTFAKGSCPAPLVRTAHGCDAPDLRVAVPAASILVGPSDWEAEGRFPARTLVVAAFRIDAFEATIGRLRAAHHAPLAAASEEEPSRAASGLSRAEAEAFCASQGGRLPTEEEWIAAVAGGAAPVRRYPWGDTGAVCRRAAWGLLVGPCARGDDGPDTVGAHPDGDAPGGLHDAAGNVAEWVVAGAAEKSNPHIGIAKGGSWATSLASDLRLWARLELDPAAGDPRVGVRCAYPP